MLCVSPKNLSNAYNWTYVLPDILPFPVCVLRGFVATRHVRVWTWNIQAV